MLIRLDFSDGPPRGRALRVTPSRGSGTHIIAQLSPHLPFKDGSIDEITLGRSLAGAGQFPAVMRELWRVCRPGTLVRARLPHASSSWAASRQPEPVRPFTLETFAAFDPGSDLAPANGRAAFRLEGGRLYLTGPRAGGSGVSRARGAVASVVEAFVNQNRGMQYRWERWLAPWLGGFEEFAVVLRAVKDPGLG